MNDEDQETSEPLDVRQDQAPNDELTAYHRIDRTRSPRVADRFDPSLDDDVSIADRPERAPAMSTDPRRLEGPTGAPKGADVARAARAGTRSVPSSIARNEAELRAVVTRAMPSSFSTATPELSSPRSNANSRLETLVRWPEDLAGQWPELPENPPPPEDGSAGQLRASERLRRLDAEQRGTRWNG